MVNQQNDLAKFNLRTNRKINGWTLSKRLGSGGNGEVWMCRNDKKEEYAIKFFKYASTFPHCSMKSIEYLWPKTKRLVKDERRSKSKLRVCA